jgi:zinc protease
MRNVAPALLLLTLFASSSTRAETSMEKPLPAELPPFGQDKPLPAPEIVESKLPDGLSVWLVKRPGFPKVTALLAVRGGRASDPPELPGMAEIFADTLKEGTATRSSRQIAEELQSVGGSIDTSATNDSVSVQVSGLATGASQLLEVLADVARNASFPAEEIELAKSNALQQLKVRQSTPEFLASKAFNKAVFGDHPYSVVAPTEATLQAITPELLKRELARRFRPERALLIVSGDFDAAAAAAAVAKAFGGWKASGTAPEPVPPVPASNGRKLLMVQRPGSVQSLIMAGGRTPTVTDPEYYGLLVANTVFAGSFGSRIMKNLREEKGYSYSPFGFVAPYEKCGLLQVRADVRNEVTGPSLKEIFGELDRMGKERVTDQELSRAKRFQTGLFLLRNQTQGALAQTLARNWVNGLPPGALAEFVPKVNAVTAEDIQKIGETLYRPDAQAVVVVGEKKALEKELAPFGPFTEVAP